MTSITQTVPNYTAGISQQPDQFKNPGQVSDAINVIPDVTQGLVKRPGSSYIKTLTPASNSTYFHYYRDDAEQYIGNIDLSSGAVKIWSLKDIDINHPNDHHITSLRGQSVKAGDEVKITSMNSEITNYLTHTNTEDLQFLTVNDYTYINNKTKTVAMKTDSNDATVGKSVDRLNHNCAYMELKQTVNARQYGFNLFTNNNANTLIKTVTKLKHKDNYPTATSGAFPAAEFRLHNGDDWNTKLSNESTYGGNNAADKYKSPNITGQPFHSRQWIYTGTGTDGNYFPRNNPTCPDIGTAVFSTAESPSNPVVWSEPNVKIFNAAGSQVTDGSRKNLVWRFTVKGRNTLHGASSNNPQGPDYVCTYDYDVELLHGGEGWEVGDYVQFTMDASGFSDTDSDAVFNVVYFVEVVETSQAYVKGDLLAGRPAPTAFDQDTAVTAQTILGQLQTECARISDQNDPAYKDTAGKRITSTIVGNGLYLTRPVIEGEDIDENSFMVETPDSDLLNVFGKEINDVSKLPTQCVHGYIVKVLNSDIEDDDYYLKFVGDNGNHGPGSWVECAQPLIENEYDKATMPLQLVRNANDSTDGYSFTIQQVDYVKRKVGDENTNPKASFVGAKINKVLFWRNRIAFLSGTNVILSQPGDDNIITPNFWAKTALTLSPEDVIDLSASSTYPANLQDGMETPAGLVLFSQNQQFLMTAEAEVLNAETAKIDPIAAYNYNTKNPPVSLGTTTGFLDNAGKKSRFFEMVNIQRSREPTILEQSVVVPELLPKNIDLITASRENNIILTAVKDQAYIYGYKYFNSGEKRIQSAWFKWKLRKNIKHMAIIDDSLYVIDSVNNLTKFDLKDTDTTGNIDTIVDDNDPPYNPVAIDHNIHLDNYTELAASNFTYSNSTKKTTFTLPTGFESGVDVVVIDDTPNDGTNKDFGRYEIASVSGTTATLKGDWDTNNHDLYIGYNYDMEVTFPKIYVRKQEAVDVNGSLIVHRIKIGLGDSGVYETTIKRDGKDDYTELIESSYQDLYQSNTSPWLKERTHTLPVYERNTNLTFSLKSTHPSPATIYSMSWEGDYTNRYYKRV